VGTVTPMATDAPVSVVTGANSGIGRATAIHLAQRGHTVYGTVRATARLDKQRAMAEQADVEIHLVELDVADDDSVRDGFARILDEAGRVDTLVDNAGIDGNGVAEEASPSLYLDVMNVNLCGAVRCLQAVLPQMRERGSGSIVNVTSIAGRAMSWGGKKLVERRAVMDDDDRVALGALQDDSDYYHRFEELFDLDIAPR
jgi:NAD(P)-dependent dehydrogenase (short-subunit alcohol dehydrogenase family)